MSQRADLHPFVEFVHFTCTSEDVNNLAYALMLKESRSMVMEKSVQRLLGSINGLVEAGKDARMIGRTHGQTATPTTMGKELANYHYRLTRLNNQCNEVEFAGKFNGAVGNYNAHVFVYPEYDWINISRRFVEGLGLEWSPYSTQIENHDSMCTYFSALRHFNVVCLGLSRDMWHYISLGYFSQKTVKGEVGSSTMPHKVNPIDFENAEGNLGVANSLLNHFVEKLPMTRFQRDLSDSTVLRNIGVALGHTLLSQQSLNKGFSRVDLNAARMDEELSSHWELLAEPVQMLLRRHGIEGAYEKLKDLTRGAKVTQDSLHTFVNDLKVDESIKKKLRGLNPGDYTGLAGTLVSSLGKYEEEALERSRRVATQTSPSASRQHSETKRKSN